MTRFVPFILLVSLAFTAPPISAETVHIESGPIRGVASEGLVSFLGIPFAIPPVGPLRWMPPIAHEPWEAPLKVDSYADSCGPVWQGDAPVSEDCLYLNVWTSELSGERPVMVWIHGGGFRGGSGRLPESFARAMTARGVVLVSIQYRLGLMGFFAHEALDEDVANFALLDMVQALNWIRSNIASFGGDANRVTIFGVSAGGMAVQMLMTSPLSGGLFSGAIAQSGYGTWPLPDKAEAASNTGRLASIAGIKPDQATAETLREVSADDWAQTYATFQLPIIDGISLVEEPAQTFSKGSQHPLPMILGNTSFEGTTIEGAGFKAETYFDAWGEQAKKARELYASDSDKGEEVAAMRFFGDVRYVVGSRLIARLNSQTAPSYLYYFDQVPPSMRDAWVGAPHGFATAVLFGASSGATGGEAAAETRAIGRLLRDYWSNFAHYRDPNGEGLPRWTQYDSDKDNWLAVRDRAEMRFEVIKPKLDFIEAEYRRRVGSR